jgi:hypothetical protein
MELTSSLHNIDGLDRLQVACVCVWVCDARGALTHCPMPDELHTALTAAHIYSHLNSSPSASHSSNVDIVCLTKCISVKSSSAAVVGEGATTGQTTPPSRMGPSRRYQPPEPKSSQTQCKGVVNSQTSGPKNGGSGVSK